jgi:hypothetical protein
MLRLIAAVLVIGPALSCTSSASPSRPSQVLTAVPTEHSLSGWVLSGMTGLSNARIEILDGPDTGTAPERQEDFYVFRTLHEGLVTVRASQPGYVSETATIAVHRLTAFNFSLANEATFDLSPPAR